MLEITIDPTELYDEANNRFVTVKGYSLLLEHSLVSLSKWESIHKKPFLHPTAKLSREEQIDYIRCMTVNKNVPSSAYAYLSNVNLDRINAYISDSMTATTFSKGVLGGGGRGELVTSELVYYWMVVLGIPFECEKWHLNRLITLINVCAIKNQPKKKMSNKERLAQQNTINQARRRALGTSG